MSSRNFIKHKKDGDLSSIWSHFLVANDGRSAQCKICLAVLKTLGGSTKGLHTHMAAKHNKKVTVKPTPSTSQPSQEAEPPTKRIFTSVADYLVKKDTLDDILARMTAIDHLPFSIFATSKDLRSLLISKGYVDLPKAASTIRNRVVNYSFNIRKQIKNELGELKKKKGNALV